jgi:glycosyltransferase involved in cell wall biosynthesis
VTVVDVSVIIPAKDAEPLLDACLASVVRSQPRDIVVVDGLSRDRTCEIARRHGARVLSDGGRGLPAARDIGVRAASCDRVALVDADVVLGDGALAALLEEFEAGDFTGLQAGLKSTGGPGYWGRALANHHRTGRSRDWFGLVATVFRRDTLLEHRLDERFASGEDIELRRRLRRAGARLGVSQRTIVTHRFGDGFAFARAQWLADGRGLGRTVGKEGMRAVGLIVLPAAAAARGIVLSLRARQPQWLPYYACYAVFNYVGMLGREP